MKKETFKIVSRVYGLSAIALGGMFLSIPELTTGDIMGTLFIAEGLGDLITGNHHYLSTRAIKYISGGKINIPSNYEGIHNTQNEKRI